MRKFVGLMFILTVLASVGFTQENTPPPPNTKYSPFDMLVGYGSGMGFNMQGDVFKLKEGFMIFTVDLGVNFDFYIFNWLSVSSGLGLAENLSMVIENDLSKDSDITITDVMNTPFCLTIPVQVHINTPRLDWLYFGTGVYINIPLFNVLDTARASSDVDLPDTKGKVFVSMPIDVGFDFGHKDKTSQRFMFRITPNFLELKTLVSFGFFYQKNYKVYSKSKPPVSAS